MIYDVIIIGAGASGLMAASRIKRGSVAIIEGNNKIGAKIIVSGGGQCNVTNEKITAQHYEGDSSFFTSVYQKLDNRALLNLFKQRGLIPTKQNRLVQNQYFCKSSQEVISYFKKETKRAKLFLSEKVVSISKDDLFRITTSKRKLSAKKVIIASGSVSFPQLGATDIGHSIAKQFGHESSRLDPALVGFTVLPDQGWFKALSGLSTPVTVSVNDRTIPGSLLCAHKGISGPAVMVASLYWKKGKISIDFLPKTNLNQLIKKSGKRNISGVLPLPKRFAKAILEAINVKDIPCSAITEPIREQLQQLKRYEFAPAGTFGFKRAEVTRGGVLTDQVNPETLESRLVTGLFFTGEVLDITGELGGYNLQWAFSSGYVCGEYLNKGISHN